MFSSKKLISIVVLAGIVTSASAFADDGKKGATVTFKAQLRAQSCDVTSTTKGSVIDWGVFTEDQIKDKKVKAQLGATEAFDLTLTNCSSDAKDASINVYASGEAAKKFPEYFANFDSKSLAVKLASNGIAVTPNKDAELTLTKNATKADGATIPMEAMLLLTQDGSAATPDILNVPVTFSVSYN